MSEVTNIHYLTNERFPAFTACSMQQMRMCEAFAARGARIRLVRPLFFDTRKNSTDDLFDFYAVAQRFPVVTMPSLLAWSKRPTAAKPSRWRVPAVGGLGQVIGSAVYLLQQKSDLPFCLYTRNLHAAWAGLQIKKHTRRRFAIFFEAHNRVHRPERWFGPVLRSCDGVITITKALADYLGDRYGLESDRLCVAPDAVTPRQVIPVEMARRHLALPETRAHWVVYTGSLLPGKGVDVLVQAAADLPVSTVVIAGGNPAEIVELEKRVAGAADVRFLGWVSTGDIWNIQCAADVLVLPNTDHPNNAFTSPLKLYEYLQSGRPVVLSDLPVFREAMPEMANLAWAQAGDPQDLARTIRALAEPDENEQRSNYMVLPPTWNDRADQILQFIRRRSPYAG